MEVGTNDEGLGVFVAPRPTSCRRTLPSVSSAHFRTHKTVSHTRRVIALPRLCCADAAPYNAEGYLVAAVWRLIGRLNDRFHVAVAMSALAVIDPYGRRHTGNIYAVSNGWWAGVSEGRTWRGFIDPATGARLSRWCGGRNRTPEECPPGWRVEPGARLNRFLWFPTREADSATNGADFRRPSGRARGGPSRVAAAGRGVAEPAEGLSGRIGNINPPWPDGRPVLVPKLRESVLIRVRVTPARIAGGRHGWCWR